jgi:hypothetical protein
MKFCILIIGAVSAYDNSMSVIYGETLHAHESNPVGLWLLSMGLDVFVTAKAITTLAVVLSCFVLAKSRYKSAIPVVASIQAVLFLYLSFYDSSSHHSCGLSVSPFSEFLSMQAKYWGLPC